MKQWLTTILLMVTVASAATAASGQTGQVVVRLTNTTQQLGIFLEGLPQETDVENVEIIFFDPLKGKGLIFSDWVFDKQNNRFVRIGFINLEEGFNNGTCFGVVGLDGDYFIEYGTAGAVPCSSGSAQLWQSAEDPEPTPQPSSTPVATWTPEAPTTTPTPSVTVGPGTPTNTPAPTNTPTATATITPLPESLFLPLVYRERQNGGNPPPPPPMEPLP